MLGSACLALLALAGGEQPSDDEIVFRTDVALVRVDAQVVDRNNHAIAGLTVDDFTLKEAGRPQEIRNFASESMPVDVLLLLDVSASMRPHVELIASTAHEAFRVLSDRDRIGIMVFDRTTRLRLPFRSDKNEAEREFEALVEQESFRGGTDITRGMLDAAEYIGREGRRDARRAIVILTDDRTERYRDDERVGRALTNADTVMSALIAADAIRLRQRPRVGRDGVVPTRRAAYDGMAASMLSAGTSQIADASGGDSVPANDASALEATLSRIRHRYALHFYQPPDATPGEERDVEVGLSEAARKLYRGAEVRYRRVYIMPSAPK
ncbi:MAG: VWA domain-containing protein [Acidobacteriota bacterium]